MFEATDSEKGLVPAGWAPAQVDLAPESAGQAAEEQVPAVVAF